MVSHGFCRREGGGICFLNRKSPLTGLLAASTTLCLTGLTIVAGQGDIGVFYTKRSTVLCMVQVVITGVWCRLCVLVCGAVCLYW